MKRNTREGLKKVDLSYEKIKGAEINGKSISVNKWKCLVPNVLKEALRYPEDEAILLTMVNEPTLNGRYPYFSTNPNDLRVPMLVYGELYVETNFSANDCAKLLNKLINYLKQQYSIDLSISLNLELTMERVG